MGKKILITDDSATARALFRACLPDGYELLEADNLNDSVNYAVNEKPFLIVLDYNMPNKTGPEIAIEMKKQGVDAYFVLMSANTQKTVIEEISALGFVDILEKPVSAEMVEAMLEKLS